MAPLDNSGLARSGVGRLILIDNDKVSLTNINRQSIAYHSTIGRMKTEVMRERIRDINPEIVVKPYETFVLPDNVEELFEETPDYIIDAIDTVTAKLAIAAFQHCPLLQFFQFNSGALCQPPYLCHHLLFLRRQQLISKYHVHI